MLKEGIFTFTHFDIAAIFDLLLDSDTFFE